MSLGKRMKEARERIGMGQKQLGLLCGFPEDSAQSRIANYEGGRNPPTVPDAAKIAANLGVLPGWLVFGEQEPDGAEHYLLQCYRTADADGKAHITSACRVASRSVLQQAAAKKRKA